MSVETRRKEREPKTETEKALMAQKTKEGLQGLAIGPVTGLLGLPSDIIDLADMANDAIAKYGADTTIAQFSKLIKPQLDAVQEKHGRDAFDKGFTELTGIKSDPTRPAQFLGELVSLGSVAKTGVKGAKLVGETISDTYKGAKKGVTDFFDKMPPPDGGLALETAGAIKPVGQLEQTKKLLDKEAVTKPIETNVPALPSAGELANKPTINPTIIGTQTDAGKKAEAIYDDLIAKGVTDSKEIFKKTGGGYVGRDGKFRFDLDDRDAVFKKDLDNIKFDEDSEGNILQTKTILLNNILKYDQLYKEYFQRINVGGKDYKALKNIKVVLDYADTGDNTLGFYRSADDTIHLNMQNLIDPRRNKQEQTDYTMSTLIHEVQHAVQRREGFYGGSNPDDTKELILNNIDEDGMHTLPLGRGKKEISLPYISGVSRYNTDSAYSAYSEADILSRAINNNSNTDKFINLADNIADDITNFTGDRKIEFLRNYEILLDSKNKLKAELEKYNIKQKKFVKDLSVPGAEVIGLGKESKGSVPIIATDIFPADFNKAKSAFGFKDLDTFANFVFEDLKSLEDLKGFVNRAYNRARVNINLNDKTLAKIEAEQARRLKNDEQLLQFKSEVDIEAKKLYREEYGEMEARLVQQRYARRQELRRDPMLFTDEQITEKMLDDTGAIFREPDKYGRTTRILGGFKKSQQLNINSNTPSSSINASVQKLKSANEKPDNPVFKKIAKYPDVKIGKDGLPVNILKNESGKPLILYYGDTGLIAEKGSDKRKYFQMTPKKSSDPPIKIQDKFRGAERLKDDLTGFGNKATFVSSNPNMASSYAFKGNPDDYEGSSLIPIYVLAKEVKDYPRAGIIEFDKLASKAPPGTVISLRNSPDSIGYDLAKEEIYPRAIHKATGQDQYAFTNGTQVFSALTGERLSATFTSKNVRNRLRNLQTKEEYGDFLRKEYNPHRKKLQELYKDNPKMLKYINSKEYLKDGDEMSFMNTYYKERLETIKNKDNLPNQKKGTVLSKDTMYQGGLQLAKGGVTMYNQMEMFQEGGLKDEGGTVDPVSGNDVPPGSTQEEVRDDIPAQLSEGEFVFPADVVRFIGLEKLMMLRQEAKAGLKRMEEMGQMGNSDEATLPDDMPFTIDDLDMEDEQEYNQGGVVQAQAGTFVAPGAGITTTPSQFTGQALPSATNIPNYVAPNIPPPAPAPVGGFRPLTTSAQTGQQNMGTTPTFQTLIGRRPGQYDEFREYVNEAGMKLQIPFKDGQPIYPIPEGYTFVDPEEEKVIDPKVTGVKPQTTRVTEEGGDDGGDGSKTSAVDLTGAPLSYKSIFDMDKLDTALKDIAFGQLNLFNLKGAAMRGITGNVDINNVTLEFQKEVMGNFKNNLVDKYGQNFNLASMNDIERNDLAESLNKSSDVVKNVLTDSNDNPLNTDDLISKANRTYGMSVVKANLMAKGTNVLSRSKITQLAKDMMKKDMEMKDRSAKARQAFEDYSDSSSDSGVTQDLSDVVSDRDKAQAAAEAGFNVDETFGGGSAPSSPNFSNVSDDSGGSEPDSGGGYGSDDSGTMGGEEVSKGSLITRRKTSGKLKKKYMKRGGLASR